MEMSSVLVGPNISPQYISITFPHYISDVPVITFSTILVGSLLWLHSQFHLVTIPSSHLNHQVR